jgi:purine nucleosidase
VTSPGGGGQTVVVATGSLTNVALLLKAFPQAASSLAGVVFLGGAFHCPGNASPLAERNVFSDPEAASDVFASGVPVTLVPINVSGRFFLPPDLVDALSRGRRLLHDYLWAILQPLKSYYQVVFGADDCPIHDPLAVLVPLVPPELFTLRRAEVSIEVTGEMTRGVTFYDVRPEADLINQESRIQIIEDVDQPAAWREIASALGLQAVNPGG